MRDAPVAEAQPQPERLLLSPEEMLSPAVLLLRVRELEWRLREVERQMIAMEMRLLNRQLEFRRAILAIPQSVGFFLGREPERVEHPLAD